MAEKKNNSVTEEPLKLLREYGVIITEALNKAPENLVQWEFLERVENSEFHYKIKVKLVRYWLVKRYPLRQAIWDLEKVDLDACRLFELAEDIAENRNLSSSDIYEQIAKLNPNHFTALFKFLILLPDNDINSRNDQPIFRDTVEQKATKLALQAQRNVSKFLQLCIGNLLTHNKKVYE